MVYAGSGSTLFLKDFDLRKATTHLLLRASGRNLASKGRADLQGNTLDQRQRTVRGTCTLTIAQSPPKRRTQATPFLP